MKTDFLKSRLSLILLGIGLGWIARIILGAPAEEFVPPRAIDRPIETQTEEVIDLPIIKSDAGNTNSEDSEFGLVPPLQLPGTFALFAASNTAESVFDRVRMNVLFDEQSHDENASFEAHGEQQCASGCAISRHPTAKLTVEKFKRLIQHYADGSMTDTNEALEELAYYGAQTRKLIESEGLGSLDHERAGFLWDQLTFTHARISIRVKDHQYSL